MDGKVAFDLLSRAHRSCEMESPHESEAWQALKSAVEIANSIQHTQPAKCLGCEYWRGPCGNCCMRGDSEESCIKVGTQQAGA